jgi:hypothetical protein
MLSIIKKKNFLLILDAAFKADQKTLSFKKIHRKLQKI